MILQIPLLNQLTSGDNNASEDCGPTCVDMISRYFGIFESVHDVKTQETGDPNYSGYTDTGEMVNWFYARGITSFQTPSDKPSKTIRDSLERGFPVIYLSYWNLADKTGGHFRVAVGYDNDFIYFNNPWQGVVDKWLDGQVNTFSKDGWLVVVEKSGPTVEDLYKQQWQSRKADVAYNPDAAILKSWLDGRRAGDTSKGVPLTDEFPFNDCSVQIFSGAIALWNKDRGVTWL